MQKICHSGVVCCFRGVAEAVIEQEFEYTGIIDFPEGGRDPDLSHYGDGKVLSLCAYSVAVK
jgi:hypothetical protein